MTDVFQDLWLRVSERTSVVENNSLFWPWRIVLCIYSNCYILSNINHVFNKKNTICLPLDITHQIQMYCIGSTFVTSLSWNARKARSVLGQPYIQRRKLNKIRIRATPTYASLTGTLSYNRFLLHLTDKSSWTSGPCCS